MGFESHRKLEWCLTARLIPPVDSPVSSLSGEWAGAYKPSYEEFPPILLVFSNIIRLWKSALLVRMPPPGLPLAPPAKRQDVAHSDGLKRIRK